MTKGIKEATEKKVCEVCAMDIDEDAVMVDFDVKGNKCPVHQECYEKMMEEVRIEHDDRGRDDEL